VLLSGVSSHRLKKARPSTKSTAIQEKAKEKEEPSNVKVDKVSVTGIANSAIGIAELTINVLTLEENKPATKGDIMKLATNLKRIHKIKNLPPNKIGQYPYFDLNEFTLVYLGLTLIF
jgi:hypothetical protein